MGMGERGRLRADPVVQAAASPPRVARHPSPWRRATVSPSRPRSPERSPTPPLEAQQLQAEPAPAPAPAPAAVRSPVYRWETPPVYQWQTDGSPRKPKPRPKQPVPPAAAPPAASPAPPPPPPLPPQLPPPRRSTTPQQTPAPAADPEAYVVNPFDLTGAWVSQPGGEEALDVAHDRTTGSLVGIVLKAAPWSDFRQGDTVGGKVGRSGEVTLETGGSPVLKLLAKFGHGGEVVLLPGAGAEGTSGFWRLIRHAATSVSDLPCWADQATPHGLAHPAPPADQVDGASGLEINIFA
eukprot:TRINITY_DN3038_c0_g1_i2.p2 TRINITY_DN3038_c0_g1~~TRINITY_DN3038_c0_g1_i2.p2  ORF type:complete len:295 (+),score=83.98 TRINITY_DN3038_c0_g1_i2:161-1045(+)